MAGAGPFDPMENIILDGGRMAIRTAMALAISTPVAKVRKKDCMSMYERKARTSKTSTGAIKRFIHTKKTPKGHKNSTGRS